MWPLDCQTRDSRTAPARRCDYWWDDGTKWGLSLVTAPAIEPVTAEEVKNQARIDIPDDDFWLLQSISAARELAEGFTKRSFITTSWRLTLDQMPKGLFYLPNPKLLTVTSLKYYDTDGTQQTISSSNYRVDTYTEPGRIEFLSTYSVPSIQDRINAIEVIFTAGYGATAASVPNTIKRAICITVAAWNEDREGSQELPMAAKQLLRRHSWGFLP